MSIAEKIASIGFGFSTGLIGGIFINRTMSIHKLFDIPKPILTMPLNLMQVYSLSKFNPYGDKQNYNLYGGIIAIITGLILGEYDFIIPSDTKDDITSNIVINLSDNKILFYGKEIDIKDFYYIITMSLKYKIPTIIENKA